MNPNANKLFLVYKSASGFNCFYTRIYFLDGTSEERHYLISTDNVNKVELTTSQYIESKLNFDYSKLLREISPEFF